MTWLACEIVSSQEGILNLKRPREVEENARSSYGGSLFGVPISQDFGRREHGFAYYVYSNLGQHAR